MTNLYLFKISRIDNAIGEIEKGDFEHFMLKEIFEQPKTIEDTFRGRIGPDRSSIVPWRIDGDFSKVGRGKKNYSDWLRNFLACSTCGRISDRNLCPCAG